MDVLDLNHRNKHNMEIEMACVYDEVVFGKFKDLSVKSADEFVVGQTYYTNCYPEEFTFMGLETKKQNDIRHSFDPRDYYDDSPTWIVYGPNEWDTMSLSDKNVGASYNPWLIFSNESDAVRCRDELDVKITSDGWDDYDYDEFDDYQLETEE